ncbi:LytR/AlgR family response regulator transcription factor [Flavobacterium sp. RHBU_3]|uniref:LytR/AlgR family response regulator transcription factor n=1 Tax=Flavobacterium sp. RHBU_3 TaxID=3391184 RepID=UPI0039847829
MKNLKCIAIDDEPLAVKLIETFVAQTPFLYLAATSDNALDGMKLIKEHNPDLVFLDINMPQFTGMEMAHWLQQANTAGIKIIFTTAYNHFAIEGYKVNAIDYLLKPFGYDEFLRAASKALRLSQQETTTPEVNQEQDALFIKVEYQWIKVHFDDILYIEGLKDYVKFHLRSQDRAVLSLTSLKALEERLPSTQFLRIHRSFIVALKKIDSITKSSIIIGNKEITIGEQYREAFKVIIAKWIL